MGKLKESKGLYVFLSIVLAICLWAYVRVVDDPEVDVRLNNLPIVLTSEDVLESRGLMVNEVTPESVSITFHGANSGDQRVKTEQAVFIGGSVQNHFRRGILSHLYHQLSR